jgi:hypothetical protein
MQHGHALTKSAATINTALHVDIQIHFLHYIPVLITSPLFAH